MKLKKMNPKVKVKWLRALRSGKYKQTTSVLREVNVKGKIKGYCCLGVLTDLYAKEHKIKFEAARPKGDSELISGKVKEWAGLTRRNPKVCVVGEDSTVELAELNDSGYYQKGKHVRFTFKKIASAIENSL